MTGPLAPRVVVAADAADLRKGARLLPRVVKGKVLKMDGPSAQGFLSLTALRAEGCGIALSGDEYKVSVMREGS